MLMIFVNLCDCACLTAGTPDACSNWTHTYTRRGRVASKVQQERVGSAGDQALQ